VGLGMFTSLSTAAGPGPAINSAGGYRPTTGEPGGRGFRLTGDWTAGAGGWERKALKDEMARPARNSGLALGGEAVEGGEEEEEGCERAPSRSDAVACIIN
jgi:hypothetical protein